MRKTKLYQSCHASRPRSCHRSHRRRGITSACAEQTNGSTTDAPRRRDHLRVCGADLESLTRSESGTGSPPRVRSRPGRIPPQGHEPGITSACAEQTRWSRCRTPAEPDHLRVCGADSICAVFDHALLGSPPRVRSRRRSHRLCERWPGITSACAEQTTGISCPCRVDRDHLRVCGADCMNVVFCSGVRGSPPRVRSRPPARPDHGAQRGITSACAEQTSNASSNALTWRDHLRVCGADAHYAPAGEAPPGSPPRVRSRRPPVQPPPAQRGITSACAEQTTRLARQAW